MKRTTNLFVLLLFVLLTVLMTWPVVLHMKSALKSTGDPFLNTWILAWDVHQLLTSPGNLFEANIFYPHPHTLAYSEHLLASSLIAMPFILIWKSPLLGYNAVFLFSFIFSGWGMYLLIRSLTGKIFPGVCGGIIFAFCPFQFGHLTHLHLLTIQWLPFVFLYFHRFIRSNNKRDLLLFTTFFLLLTFSSLHVALFSSIALFLAFLFFVRRIHVPKIALFILIALVVFFPVARIYLNLQKEMGFVRTIENARYYSASFKNYLAAPGGNRLYGELTHRFSEPERELFPGVIALVLTILAFTPLGTSKTSPGKARSPTLRRIQLFYLTVGIVSLLLSLGPFFPLYRFCYSYFPGFKGVRVPARFAIMVVFSLSVLSGFGLAKIIPDRKMAFWKIALMILVLPAILFEYWSAPLSLYRLHRAKWEVPEVYKWLSGKDENSVIVELPMASSVESVFHETRYMYWSTFHWKKMVNGYSGFFPSDYWEINGTMQEFPSEKSIALLRDLGVTYVIIHASKFRRGRWLEMKEKLPSSDMIIFGTVHVYQVDGGMGPGLDI